MKAFPAVLLLVAGAVVVVDSYGGQNAPAAAMTRVELKRVHMCCDGCAVEVKELLQKVAGVKDVAVDMEAKTARFAAADIKAAQSALNALALAGFHGDSGSQMFSFKDDSGVKPGNVTSLTLTAFHNSCAGCVRSFREAIKDVPGITSDTLKPKVTTCEIRGNFDAARIVQALNKSGFHVKVKS